MRGIRRPARPRRQWLALLAVPVLAVVALAGSGTATGFTPGPVTDVTSGGAANTGSVIVPPEWSGDSTLVFAGQAGDGSEKLRTVSSSGGAVSDVTTLAPAGQIVANIAVNGNQAVFVPKTAPPPFPLARVNLDGTGLTTLASFADDTPAKFSPDGSVVAFTQTGGLRLTTANPNAPTVLQSPAAPATSSLLHWSSANKLFALAQAPGFPPSSSLYSLDPTPAATPATSPIVLGNTPPAVSPDGTKVLWTDATGLHIANLDGSGKLDLDPAGQQGSFSADGTMVAFLAPGGLYTENADGTNKTQVSTSTDCILPRLNPGVTRIACFHVTTHDIAVVTLPLAAAGTSSGSDETIHANDEITIVPAGSVASDETIHASDEIAIVPPASTSSDETVHASDEVGIFPAQSIANDESIGVGDVVAVVPPASVGAGEGIGVAENTLVVPSPVISLQDGIGVGENTLVVPSPVIPLQDGVGVGENVAVQAQPLTIAFLQQLVVSMKLPNGFQNDLLNKLKNALKLLDAAAVQPFALASVQSNQSKGCAELGGFAGAVVNQLGNQSPGLTADQARTLLEALYAVEGGYDCIDASSGVPAAEQAVVMLIAAINANVAENGLAQDLRNKASDAGVQAATGGKDACKKLAELAKSVAAQPARKLSVPAAAAIEAAVAAVQLPLGC